MDDSSEGRFKTILKSFFGSKANGHDLEDHILDAKQDGEIEGEEVSMLLNILDLDEKIVDEVMIPRTDMISVSHDQTIQETARLIIGSGLFSRIPVFRDTKDQILGVIHAKDLLPPLLAGEHDEPVTQYMRSACYIPEGMPLDKLLSVFKKNSVHLAIIQDEYGGTTGLVTLGDVVEEIVGEIADEHDADRPDEVEELGNGSYNISGRLTLEELDEKCAIDIDSDQVDSVGGYLAALAGRIPRQGEFFTLANHRFTVVKADKRQVWKIRIDNLSPESE